MDNNQAMRDFLREKLYRDVVMKYQNEKGLEIASIKGNEVKRSKIEGEER